MRLECEKQGHDWKVWKEGGGKIEEVLGAVFKIAESEHDRNCDNFEFEIQTEALFGYKNDQDFG